MHVVVIVLGDVDQSPRMMAHALACQQAGHCVSLIAYRTLSSQQGGQNGLRMISLGEAPSSIHQTNSRRGRWTYLIKALRSLMERCLQWLMVLGHVGRMDLILMQNPPALPTMMLVYVMWFILGRKGSRIVVDWHNTTSSMMAVHGAPSWAVRIASAMERHVGRRIAHLHLCVSAAMQRYLVECARVRAHRTMVLYDRPRKALIENARLSREESRAQVLRECLGLDSPDDASLPVLLSSTSWTPDENLDMLLDALMILERDYDWRGIVVITGRGPMRDAFVENKWPSTGFRRIRLVALWLPRRRDYARVLAHANVGVSMHASSSGLDLPMKVMDMLGCGLPVVTHDYPCLSSELGIPSIREYSSNKDPSKQGGSVGVAFANANELAKAILYALSNSVRLRATIKQNYISNPLWCWESYWAETFLPFLNQE